MNGWPYGYGGMPYNPQLYWMADQEKRSIRRLSNLVSWITLLCIFLLYVLTEAGLVLQRSFGYPPEQGLRGFGGIDPRLYFIISGFAYIAALALPFFLFLLISRIPIGECLPFQKTGALKMTACVFFGVAACMLANIPANMVSQAEKAIGFSGELPPTPLTDDPVVLVLYGISVMVIPPMVEEMIFRGMLLQSLRRFGDGFAIVVSALFFGFYHGNFVQLVFAFTCGLAFGLVAVKTNSLLPGILIHFANNGISFLLELVNRYYGAEKAGLINGAIFVLAILLGAAGLLYLFFRERDFFRLEQDGTALKMSAKLGAMFSSIGAVVVCIFTLALSIYTMVKL